MNGNSGYVTPTKSGYKSNHGTTDRKLGEVRISKGQYLTLERRKLMNTPTG